MEQLPWPRRPGPRTHAGPAADHPPASAEWRLVLRALRELTGAERGVFYDVPRTAAPQRMPGTPVFLHGSPEWQSFLEAREALDDGGLTLLLALRPLSDTERLLAVDWGNTYANAFLLIEPTDPGFDLTDRTNAMRRALEASARELLRGRDGEAASGDSWTRATPLGAALRAAYGTWTVWSSTPPGSCRRLGLQANGPQETLVDVMRRLLRAWFPQEAFERTLARLYDREPELFSGHEVARARIPFLTRLGLPVLHEPRHVDHALRALVNDGRVWVYERGPDARVYHGPHRPVPDDVSDDEFAHLVM